VLVPKRLRRLDFVVIGAAKSGTTTLFRLLEPHPRVFIPAGKEVPFFTKDDVYDKGWDWYLEEHFASARPDQVWGTITPRYLGDLQVPARMAADVPDARLLALLRNPIDRALSKYRMLVRDQLEHRSFAQLVDDELRPDRLARARETTVPIREAVVARGEYGRLLGDYLAHYPPERLHVWFTDELEDDPQAVVDGVLSVLDLEPGWRSPALGVRAFQGGDVARFPRATRAVARNRVLARAWRLIPGERRRAIGHRYRTEVNVRRSTGPEPAVPPEVRARLVELYRPDVRRLEATIGRPVPWTELRTP